VLWSVNEVCDLCSVDNNSDAISVPSHTDLHESSSESEFCRYSENEDKFVGGVTIQNVTQDPGPLIIHHPKIRRSINTINTVCQCPIRGSASREKGCFI
jgi:hypothetical protein